jgi:hypothetical protein
VIAVRLSLFVLAAILIGWIYTGRSAETMGPVDSYVCTVENDRCSRKWDNWRIVE